MTKLITGIAALFLTTGTAHASVHRSFHRCDKYLVTNAWSFDHGDKWSLLFQQNGSWKMRPLSGRLLRQTHTGNIYFRKLKCSESLAYSEVPDGAKDLIWVKPPE
jgi:hypothetical protein